ncbi:rpom-1 [Blepharisma stoltei]|uniref:DNA-directed RNA polymerase n=1 Tax=Blepharisma stoltei TaxID=1481888 RepID=A0AAU9IT53_9CILI|nr:unnamed protein product [Blepharisma stoltei]
MLRLKCHYLWREFTTDNKSFRWLGSTLTESAVVSIIYLSRLKKKDLISSLDHFREHLIPIENREKIPIKIAELFNQKDILAKLPEFKPNYLYEKQIFLNRFDLNKKDKLLNEAKSMDLTPAGISDALKIFYEFCDKSGVGFLTGDISIELYDILIANLNKFRNGKNSNSVEVYDEIRKFMSKQQFSLPINGIKEIQHENQKALYQRQLILEKDVSIIKLQNSDSDLDLFNLKALGLNTITYKEKIITLFSKFCEAIRTKQADSLKKGSKEKYSELMTEIEPEKIAVVTYNSITRMLAPKTDEFFGDVEVKYIAMLSQFQKDMQNHLVEEEKQKIFQAFNESEVKKRRPAIRDSLELIKRCSKEIKKAREKYQGEQEAIIAFCNLILEMFIRSSKIKGDYGNDTSAVEHKVSQIKVGNEIRNCGYLVFKHEFIEALLSRLGDSRDSEAVVYLEKTLPMICKPLDWTSANKGGYYHKGFSIVRSTGSDLQKNAMERGNLSKVFEVLNLMGKCPWKINSRILDVIEALHSNGGGVGEIPFTNIDEKFRIEAGITPKEKGKIEKARRDNFSLLSDFEIKLGIARKFKQVSRFFMPLNLDFRGRIYPISPHLNQLGNDLSRGLLEFADGKPIGNKGLWWLKIHVANKMGFDKLQLDKRVDIAEQKLDDFFKIAKDPVQYSEWLTYEDPWQSLAAIFDLTDALQKKDPSQHISYLHIHQDGSCNGLQHYAAMGRDIEGAEQVNLVDKDVPGDLYTAVSIKVQEKVNKDAADGHELAKLLVDKVKRKIVKQTVMTSVYGVTFIGARDQILKQLKEREVVEEDKQWDCAIYLAKLTLSSITGFFQNAQKIKDWLIDCAGIIAKQGYPVTWITPMGFPVVQPYRQERFDLSISTAFQKVNLIRHHDNLPVNIPKQKSAFPPNYVHSLDSTHLMRTALRCHKQGIAFAAVHDSYWTHACDLDEMNRMLREEFVQLHSEPLLENLLKGFKVRFPGVNFEDVPSKGNFDLRNVLTSKYFFA